MNNYIYNVMVVYIIYNLFLCYWQFIICDVFYLVEEFVDFSIDFRNVWYSIVEILGSNI